MSVFVSVSVSVRSDASVYVSIPIFVCAALFLCTPFQEEQRINKEEESRLARASSTWQPWFWKRAQLVMVAYAVVMVCVVILEFSYSDWYGDRQYEALVLIKLASIFFEMYLVTQLRDNLLVSPIMIIVNVTELLITMGAEDFTDFVVAFFVELAMNILERVYLDPAIKAVIALWPKWVIQCKRRIRRNRVLLTREQRKKEDREWKRVLEDIARETEGVEPLLDSYLSYANTLTALLLSPFVQCFLLLTDTTGVQVTQVPDLYGIRSNDLIYYTVFSIVIIPATIAMDIFLFNTLELVHGWRLYDYVSYQRYRFSVRDKRWQIASDAYDESISEGLQTADLMCFSSQFYFITTVTAYGLFLLLMGITVHIRVPWNIFGDPATPLIVIIVWILVRIKKWLMVIFANLVGLWRLTGGEGQLLWCFGGQRVVRVADVGWLFCRLSFCQAPLKTASTPSWLSAS